MTVQYLRDLLTAQPFKPFRVVMSSGQFFDVPHPEMAWVTKSDLLVGIPDFDEAVPASHRTLSLLHVTSVEPLVLKTVLTPQS